MGDIRGDGGANTRATRGKGNVVSTREKAGGTLSPRHRFENLRWREGSSRSRSKIQLEIAGVIVDANVIVIGCIVGGGHVVGELGGGDVERQKESPDLDQVMAGGLIASGTLAGGCKEGQGRTASSAGRGNGDRPWAGRDADVRARSEGGEYRRVACRTDQDLPVASGECRSHIRGAGEVGDSIRRARARKTATTGAAASPSRPVPYPGLAGGGAGHQTDGAAGDDWVWSCCQWRIGRNRGDRAAATGGVTMSVSAQVL